MAGDDHLVIGCSLLNNGGFGATIANGMLKGNHVFNNGGQGLNASFSTISGNICRNNMGNGIDAYMGSTVVDNTVYGSSGTDVVGINTSDGCTVMRNTSRGNSGVGIHTGNNCTIINNTTQGLTYGATGCTALENTTY